MPSTEARCVAISVGLWGGFGFLWDQRRAAVSNSSFDTEDHPRRSFSRASLSFQQQSVRRRSGAILIKRRDLPCSVFWNCGSGRGFEIARSPAVRFGTL